jgi:hypothetical protein
MPGKSGVGAELGQECDVAIVGAGPIGLMIANLLAVGGVRVALFERNRGLVGLPRAIAYDAETLRLFAQVGLYDEIAPGLVRDPPVHHINARGKTLMAAQFAHGLYGHSPLGTFYQPQFERVLLKGLSRFGNVSVAFEHAVNPRAGRPRRDDDDRDPQRRAHIEGRLRRRMRWGNERHSRGARRQIGGLDLCGALARRRRHRQGPQCQMDHLHVRPAPSVRRAARGWRPGPLGIHANARRMRGGAQARRYRTRARQAQGRHRWVRDRAQGRQICAATARTMPRPMPLTAPIKMAALSFSIHPCRTCGSNVEIGVGLCG